MTSIAQERAGLAAVGMRLRRREEWGAARTYTDSRPVTEPAAYQFVHITITNPDNFRNDDAHARAVERIGIARFPNTGISYNRLIFQSGGAYEGQPIGRRGAHTVNDDQRSTCGTSGCPTRGGSVAAPSFNLNLNARAYVICQNVDDVVTPKQLDSLAKAMAADRLAGFVRRGAGIHGHRCVSSKGCPGDKMWVLMGQLKTKIQHYLDNGLQPPPPPPPPPPEDDEMFRVLVASDPEPRRKFLVSGGMKTHIPTMAVDAELAEAGIPDKGEMSTAALNLWPTSTSVLTVLNDILAAHQEPAPEPTPTP